MLVDKMRNNLVEVRKKKGKAAEKVSGLVNKVLR